MIYKATVVGIAATLTGAPIFAAELNGARITLGYERLSDELIVNGDEEELSKVTLEASAEIGFSREFALQVDTSLTPLRTERSLQPLNAGHSIFCTCDLTRKNMDRFDRVEGAP